MNGLLRKWSLETNDGDFISLLARLDVENSSKVSGYMIYDSMWLVHTAQSLCSVAIPTPLQVTGLALRKLFDNFTVQELISSMAERLGPSQGHTPRPAYASSPPLTVSEGSLSDCPG